LAHLHVFAAVLPRLASDAFDFGNRIASGVFDADESAHVVDAPCGVDARRAVVLAHVVGSWRWAARASTKDTAPSMIELPLRASSTAAGCWARADFRRWYAALVSLSSLTECQMVSRSASNPSTPTGALGGGCRCRGYSPSGRSIPSEVGRMNVVVLPPSESLRLTSFATACASAGGCGAAASMAR